jgi:hypothetical protein
MADLGRIMAHGRKPTQRDLQAAIHNQHLPALEKMLGVDAFVTLDTEFDRAVIEYGEPVYLYVGGRVTMQKGALALEMQLRRFP